jgi:hypothetical protein
MKRKRERDKETEREREIEGKEGKEMGGEPFRMILPLRV